MDKAFQARLRAERSERPATYRERIVRGSFWLVSGAVITSLIIASPDAEMSVFAFLPLVVGVVGAAQSSRKFQVTEFTAQAEIDIQDARREDRLQLYSEIKKAATNWFGRMIFSGLVIYCCYSYASGPQKLSPDEVLGVVALVVGALVWAWQTSLVLAACAGLWWLTTLNWHISTPAAVILGAVIIAIAVNGKK
jgi:hypothetical protein